MIDMLLATLLAAAGVSSETACTTGDDNPFENLLDVCDPAIMGARAYSATYSASLTPSPGTQQVTIFERDGEWFMRFAGFAWGPGKTLRIRNGEHAISAEEALDLAQRFDTASEQLAQLSYYGAPDVICTDGSRVELSSAVGGQRRAFAQHSCAGKSELHAIAAAFRSLAIKYQPRIEGMLRGLEG
ncbi:hypothetical protein [Qipengyuania aquimaris]|uniref:hypothetical protein n=1 Tax=Qipengyuania aquimaris TaxID=255984 RepID=UPI001CD4F06F|nr:hypothetical protein [Qipengyuania aquimaris]MCA0903165.1 hypothetical protein [Qipengyuania aquimaris]